MSINGLLYSIPFHTCPLFLNSKLILAPPSTFKLEPSSLQFSRLKHLTSPFHKHPFCSNGSSSSSVFSVVNEINRCLFLLDENPFAFRQVHALLVKLGALKFNSFAGNKLVLVYLRYFEFFDDAHKVFDEMPKRTVGSYAAMIGSLCRLEKWVDLLFVFRMMLDEGMLPDRFLVPTVLKACSFMQLVRVGKMVHGFVVKSGIVEDVFVANALIDMYANCGSLSLSKAVFDTMSCRDVVSWTVLVSAYMSQGFVDDAIDTFDRIELNGLEADLICWNALISGFARNGEIELALGCLEEMRGKGMSPKVNTWNGIISGCVQNECYEDALDAFVNMFWTYLMPDVVSFVSLLPACAGLKDLRLGEVIHGHSIKLGLTGITHLEGSLINMYWKCGRIDYAESIFARMKNKSTAIWNEMIAAYVHEGKLGSALMLFNSAKDTGWKPDQITYNTLLGAYGRDGKMEEAYELLVEMSEMGLQPNLVTFNILISSCQKSGLFCEALRLFQDMQSLSSGSFLSGLMHKSIKPNPVTVTTALAACAGLCLRNHGKELHGYILRNFFELNMFVSSALVHMYAKCHDMDSAAEVFWRTKDRNTVIWNSLLMGYINIRQLQESFSVFNRMLIEGHKPSLVTFLILIPACGEAKILRLGRELHGCLLKCQFDESDNFIASSLIDMYAKCESIWDAKRVFDSLTSRDVAVWNSMISSFAAHGMTNNAFILFTQMELSGVMPDGRTFVALLSACAHDGLVQEGWKYFNLMEHTYKITPTLEHYSCMVGIMGAVGLLDEALEFIQKMPFPPDACVWFTLLQSCRTHLNSEIGERAARALLEIEPENASIYINLSNT